MREWRRCLSCAICAQFFSMTLHFRSLFIVSSKPHFGKEAAASIEQFLEALEAFMVRFNQVQIDVIDRIRKKKVVAL
jgi:hypothetical protein